METLDTLIMFRITPDLDGHANYLDIWPDFADESPAMTLIREAIANWEADGLIDESQATAYLPEMQQWTAAEIAAAATGRGDPAAPAPAGDTPAAGPASGLTLVTARAAAPTARAAAEPDPLGVFMLAFLASVFWGISGFLFGLLAT